MSLETLVYIALVERRFLAISAFRKCVSQTCCYIVVIAMPSETLLFMILHLYRGRDFLTISDFRKGVSQTCCIIVTLIVMSLETLVLYCTSSKGFACNFRVPESFTDVLSHKYSHHCEVFGNLCFIWHCSKMFPYNFRHLQRTFTYML